MGTLFIILMILAGFFALVQVFRTKDNFARIISGIMGLGVGVSFIPIPEVAIDGHYLFLIGCFLVILYAFNDSSFSNFKKIVLVEMGAVQLTAHLFWLEQWPYVDVLFWFSLVTVIAYIFIVTREIREYQFEIGFLTVLMVDALIKTIIVMSSTFSTDEVVTHVNF